MAQFSIELQSGKRYGVQQGMVRKVSMPFSFLFRKPPDIAAKKGYIVTAHSGYGSQEQYRLLKTSSGDWITDGEADFQAAGSDELSLQIQQAIDEYEKQQVGQYRK